MKLGITVAALAVLAVGGVIVSQSSSGAQAPQSSQQVLSATSKQLASGTTIYDVRTAGEFTTSHVAQATLFPLTDMQAGKLPDVPKDTPIALYCRSGHRAGQALEILQKAGYTNVTSLGGLTNLADYGLKAE